MSDAEYDRERIALGIRQPWAELILRGIKTVEIRSVDTNIRGTIYLYASKRLSELPAAAVVGKRHGIDVEKLPRGVIVGTAELHRTAAADEGDAAPACIPAELLVGRIGWHFRDPRRLDNPVPARFLPYGIWFYPFQRRGARGRRRRA